MVGKIIFVAIVSGGIIRKHHYNAFEVYELLFDHALSHESSGGKISLKNNGDLQSSFQVPFFITDSDAKEQVRITRKRSGFNMIYGLAEWLAISSTELNQGYRFFATGDDQQITVINQHHERVLFDNLSADPLPER